jgi:hypothetical protein
MEKMNLINKTSRRHYAFLPPMISFHLAVCIFETAAQGKEVVSNMIVIKLGDQVGIPLHSWLQTSLVSKD